MLTDEERRVVHAVLNWIRVRQACQPSERAALLTAADADHSALLTRLLAGQEPLPVPPPRAFSQPWYELMETGQAERTLVETVHAASDVLSINQCLWMIVERVSPSEFIVRYRDSEPRWRLWTETPDDSWSWRLQRLDEEGGPR